MHAGDITARLDLEMKSMVVTVQRFVTDHAEELKAVVETELRRAVEAMDPSTIETMIRDRVQVELDIAYKRAIDDAVGSAVKNIFWNGQSDRIEREVLKEVIKNQRQRVASKSKGKRKP